MTLGSSTLTAGAANSTTFTGVIQGAGGSFIKAGSGTLTLARTNTYTGATTITNGTLALGSSGNISNSSGVNLTGSSAIFDVSSGNKIIKDLSGVADSIVHLGSHQLTAGTNNTTTFAGVISDGGINGGTGGSFNKTGIGELILTGANTYTGTTTITQGILQIGEDVDGGGTTGSLASQSIINNTTLQFSRSDAITYGGGISGSGNMNQVGNGTLILTGVNTYTGQTNIHLGTVQIGNGSNTGSIDNSSVSLLATNATLAFDRSDAISFSNSISGTGNLTQMGSGTLTLDTVANTYTGVTTISNGTLVLGASGSIASSSGVNLTASGATFDITAGDQTIQDLSGVTGSLVNLGSHAFTAGAANSTTFAGDIEGSGGFTKEGAGTLTLTGANAYTGTTTINNGVLQIGSGGTTGSLASQSIIDNTTLQFYRDAITYGGVISGGGNLVQIGGGALTLTNANTYSGLTQIYGGTVQIGNGSNTGSIDNSSVSLLATNATLAFDRSDAISFSNSISGTGNLTQMGSGTLTLDTVANTYTGVTTISNGTLVLGASGSIASSSGVNLTASGATFDITAGDQTIQDLSGVTGSLVNLGSHAFTAGTANSTTFAGDIEGTGGFTKEGAGTLILTGANAYTGTTRINAGVLQIGSGGATGSLASQNIINDTTLQFSRDAITYGGVISGSGDLVQMGDGSLMLTNANTYTGLTQIDGGTLVMGTSGSVATSSGVDLTASGANFDVSSGNQTIQNLNGVTGSTVHLGGSNLTAEISANIVFNGIIDDGGISGGSGGSFTKTGTQTLLFTEDNTYTGATTISTGTLELGNGGTTGSVASTNIIDNDTLLINRSNVFTYNGNISGTGSLVQLGTGTTLLNGISSYTGNTFVEAGKLLIGDASHHDATFGGTVMVDSLGTLGGYGILTGNVTNHGIMSPGGSIGTLTIIGNYTQSAIGNYIDEIDAAGNGDLIAVGGTANLNGTLTVSALNGGFKSGYIYTALTADGGVTGEFSNVVDGQFTQGFLTGNVIYLPNAVEFTVGYNPVAFAQAAQTPNQRAVGNSILATGGTAAIQELVASLTTTSQFQEALDQLSGATYANQALALVQTGNWFGDLMSDRFAKPMDCSDEDLPNINKQFSRCNRSTRTPWVSVYGINNEIVAGDVSGLNTNIGSIAAGIDLPISDNAFVGVAGDFSHFNDSATVSEMGNAEGTLAQVGVYGTYVRGRFAFSASADAGTTLSLHANRRIQGASGLAETNSHYQANLYSQQVRGSYAMPVYRHFMAYPFIGVVNQQLSRGHFIESGSTGFELSVGSSQLQSTRSQLGTIFVLPTETIIKPFGLISWEHEFADQYGTFDANFVGLGSPFHIIGTSVGRDSLFIKAGALLLGNDKWDITASYVGRFASAWQENAGNIQVNFHLG